MVPDLIWAPDFFVPREICSPRFGPQEIWSPRTLGPTKVGSCMNMLYNDFHAGPKFLGDQKSQGPKLNLGTKKFRGQNDFGDYFSYSLVILRANLLDKSRKKLYCNMNLIHS